MCGFVIYGKQENPNDQYFISPKNDSGIVAYFGGNGFILITSLYDLCKNYLPVTDAVRTAYSYMSSLV